jgi:hypothetical protein
LRGSKCSPYVSLVVVGSPRRAEMAREQAQGVEQARAQAQRLEQQRGRGM